MSLFLNYFRLLFPGVGTESICASSGKFLAIVVKPGNKIGFWNFRFPEKELSYLVGHYHSISAVSFSHFGHGRYLCSCSTDNIILWDLLENEGKPERGRVLLSNIEKPLCCCFSHDDSKIIICSARELFVFNLQTMKHHVVEAQSNKIYACVLGWENYWFTIDENNSLKLWDMSTLEIRVKKYITPSSPSSITVHLESQHLAVGTTSGSLYIYASEFCLIRNIQVWRILKNLKSHKETSQEFDSEGANYYDSDINYHILAIHFYTLHCAAHGDFEKFLPQALHIAVVTTSCFFLLCVNTEQIVFDFDFREKKMVQDENNVPGLMRSATISCDKTECMMFISLIPIISNSVILLRISEYELFESHVNKHVKQIPITKTIIMQNDKTLSNLGCLSFLSSHKFNGSHSFLLCKKNRSTSEKSQAPLKSGALVSSLHQPVTFHTKIKSSGYGLLHSSVMFQPKLSTKKLQCTYRLPKSPGSCTLSNATSDSWNIFPHEKPSLLCKLAISNSPVITSSHISGDGQHALCALNDGSVEIFRKGKSKMKKIYTLCCHTQSIICSNWSHSKDLIITSSSDKTVKLWRWAKQQQDPILSVNGGGISLVTANKTTKSNELFPDVVPNAQFYYVDQFLLLSCNNSVYLFSYNLNAKKTDLIRYEKNCSKLVTMIQLSSQRVTALAGINQFFSNLVICAGSSKCLDVCDMNTGTVVWHADAVSNKPPFQISLNEGSVNSNQPPYMRDIFMTSSLFDGVKLWDLRTKRCILCYKEHQCRSFPCGASFSACGRYIATGSEDKSVYIYDLRSISSLHKLTNHSDVITDVSFSSMYRQLLASSSNGVIYLYGHPSP